MGGDEASGEASGETARFEDEDLAMVEFEKRGRDASGLAGSRRGFKDEIPFGAEVREKVGEHGMGGALRYQCGRVGKGMAVH